MNPSEGLGRGFSALWIPLEEAPDFRERLRGQGVRVVATNGCFDLFHPGHLHCLERARTLGDFLWVGVNSDRSVRELKGPGRPIWGEETRIRVLRALRVIDAVTLFDSTTAEGFLEEICPEVYVKGADYNWETLNRHERDVLERLGTKVFFIERVPGYSTTELLGSLDSG